MKLRVIVGLLVLSIGCSLFSESAQASSKISARSAASTLTGAETVPAIQSGTDKRTTTGLIAALAAGTTVVTVDRYTGTDLCAVGTGIVDQIGSSVVTLLIDRSLTCTANETVPTTLNIQMVSGGLVTVSTGVTLTINGPFNAPITQKVFTLTGTGVVAFGPSVVTRLYPQWWGGIAINDGSTDAYPAIAASLAAMATMHNPSGDAGGKSACVFLTTGQYKTSAALKVPPEGCLLGEGKGATDIYPNNNINGIELYGSDWSGGFDYRVTLADFGIRIDGASTGYYLDINTSYDMTFRNLYLWNTQKNGVRVNKCSSCSFYDTDIEGNPGANTGIGYSVTDAQNMNMYGGQIQFFQTGAKIFKTSTYVTAHFFGTYFELQANQTGVLYDNAQNCNIYGAEFQNVSAGTTPIAVSYTNSSHHNNIIGSNLGNAYLFGFNPPVKTDASSYQNRIIGSSYLGTSTANPDSRILVDFYPALFVVTYSASMTFDMTTGGVFSITATNGTAFTINAPTNPQTGMTLTVTIKNGSGGALGTATWNAVFKMGAAWTQPANTKNRSIDFYYDGTNWIETNRSAADVSN